MDDAKKIKAEISKRFIGVSQILIKKYSYSSENKFCESISLNNVSYADVKSGKLQIGVHYISKLLTVYPEVNGDYILTGRGDFFKQSNLDSEILVEAPPGKCPLCEEKEKRISILEKHIETQAQFISIQNEYINTLKEASPEADSGQKRKAV